MSISTTAKILNTPLMLWIFAAMTAATSGSADHFGTARMPGTILNFGNTFWTASIPVSAPVDTSYPPMTCALVTAVGSSLLPVTVTDAGADALRMVIFR